MYPHRVMTRRRRLRTRTTVLILAAAVAGALVIPVLGAPDTSQQALRSWDGVIGDGRSGQSVPAQVVIVLAAPPAVSIDSPEASKAAAEAQQLDLTALAARGIDLSIQYTYVNALNAVAATVRPDQLAQLRGAPEVAGVYPVRMLYPAEVVAAHLKAMSKAARPLAAGGGDGKGVSVALLDGPIDGTHPYLHQALAGWNAINGKPEDTSPGAAAARARDGDGRHRRRARRPRRAAGRRAAGLARADPGARAAARRAHGHDRHAARRDRPCARPERRRQPLRPRRCDPRPPRRAVRGLRRVGRDGCGAGRRAGRRGARRRGRQRRADGRSLRHAGLARRLARVARGRRHRRPLQPAGRERHAQLHPRADGRRRSARRRPTRRSTPLRWPAP